MRKKLTILAAAGLVATTAGAASPTPAHAVCQPDPVLGSNLVCWNDCHWAWLDPKDPVGSVEEAVKPRICPD